MQLLGAGSGEAWLAPREGNESPHGHLYWGPLAPLDSRRSQHPAARSRVLGSQEARHTAAPGQEGQRTPSRVRPIWAELSPGWSKGWGGGEEEVTVGQTLREVQRSQFWGQEPNR